MTAQPEPTAANKRAAQLDVLLARVHHHAAHGRPITCAEAVHLRHLVDTTVRDIEQRRRAAARRARDLADIPAAAVDEQHLDEEHRLALSRALGLGTSAPWDAIHERAAELHVINKQWADWLDTIRTIVGAATYAETPEKTKQLFTDYARNIKALDDATDRAERAENCPACRDPRRPHPGCPLGHLTTAPTAEQAETRHDPGHTCPDGEPCPAHDKPADDDFSKCVECGTDVPHLMLVRHMRENHPDPFEERPVSLGTPCANCDHSNNWHQPGGLCIWPGAGTHPKHARCTCDDFTPETSR